MATTLTSTTGFSDLVTDLVMRRAEEELRANHVHALPGSFMPGRLIKGTNLVRFARYADLAVKTVALSEATTPSAEALTISSESFSATQLGNVIEISDLAQIDSPHDLIAVAADRAAEQAARSMDILVREILAAGSNVRYSNGSARSAVAQSHVLTGALVKQMVSRLQAANVPTFPDGYYRAIIHPYQVYDLQTDVATGGWMDVLKYTNGPGGILTSKEVGAYAGVRFLVSSDAKVFATAGASSANIYSSFFFGPDAYCVGDSQTLQSYFVAPGGDHNDPLAQRALIGWKVRFGSMLLDEAGARYIRLETGATIG